MLAADQSFSMPWSPQHSWPCAQDCRIVISTMPREPKWLYRSGRFFHRHTFAASSSTPTSGLGIRPIGQPRANCSAASTTATVSAGTSGPAAPPTAPCPAGTPRPRRTRAFLGQAVQRAALADELVRVELRAVVVRPLRDDPAGDLAVDQELRALLRRAVHTGALLVRRVDDSGQRVGGQLQARGVAQ